VSRLKPSKLPAGEDSDNAAVRGLPALLANMLIARIDFLGRFVMSLLYGVRSWVPAVAMLIKRCSFPQFKLTCWVAPGFTV
jgi:hypothetical protein